MDLLDAFKDSPDQQDYAPGDVIFTEATEGHRMFVVISGEVEISLGDKVLATAGPGEIVGEMALINAELRSATVTARTACRLVSIDQATFESLMRHVPDFTFHIMNVLAERLHVAYQSIDSEA